jgi:hypothetical protein
VKQLGGFHMNSVDVTACGSWLPQD